MKKYIGPLLGVFMTAQAHAAAGDNIHVIIDNKDMKLQECTVPTRASNGTELNFIYIYKKSHRDPYPENPQLNSLRDKFEIKIRFPGQDPLQPSLFHQSIVTDMDNNLAERTFKLACSQNRMPYNIRYFTKNPQDIQITCSNKITGAFEIRPGLNATEANETLKICGFK